jgi:hypothetical protein
VAICVTTGADHIGAASRSKSKTLEIVRFVTIVVETVSVNFDNTSQRQAIFVFLDFFSLPRRPLRSSWR